jgi:hypothetical protein
MAKFWLVTFAYQTAQDPAPISSQIVASDQSAGWAIEIIQEEEQGEIAVLLSKVDNIEAPKKLQCVVGFANGAKASSIWRDRGFPLVDAIIENLPNAPLRVRSACFLGSDPQIDYDVELISISGITQPAPSGRRVDPPDASYEQSQEAADYAFPATWIRRRRVGWSPKRSNTIAVTPQTLTLKVESPRFPELAPLKSGKVTPNAIWYGTMELPIWPPHFPDHPLQAFSRAQEFGIPPFQFDDVEVLGFRLNLDELGVRAEDRRRLLNEMIERLNFHFEPLESPRGPGSPVIRNPIPDFRYQAGSSTIMVELLRYGKMRLKEASPPLRAEDYQSQHELVVRILVGRVDEDAAEAHSPALFVPAIFVDNPWSKIVGRSVQGFDKWMAHFCVLVDGKPEPLRPDGRLSVTSDKPEDLAGITEIRLVDTTGKGLGERTIVKLDCPFDQNENLDSFQRIDLRLASKSSSRIPLRWSQDDIRDPAFRRSFARSVIPKSIRTLSSIQVSPIGEKEFLEKWKAETTLIEGTFIADDLPQVVIPDSIATLTLRNEKTAPQAWKNLCSVLGIPEGNEDSISLVPGNWFRMRCSLELKIRDGFH